MEKSAELVDKELIASLKKDIEQLKTSKADHVPVKVASNLPLYLGLIAVVATFAAMKYFDNIKATILLFGICVGFVQICLDWFTGPSKAWWSSVARVLVVGIAFLAYKIAEVDLNILLAMARKQP